MWWLSLALALALTPAVVLASPKMDTLLTDLRIVPLEQVAPPPFSGRDMAGAPVTLSQFKGHPVLLYFWATW